MFLSDEGPTARNVRLRFPFIGSLPTFYISIFISKLPMQHTTFKTKQRRILIINEHIYTYFLRSIVPYE